MKEVSDSIRDIRKSKGMTQKELAAAIGTTQQNVAQYESGIRKPKFETLQKIAAALDVPVSALAPDIYQQAGEALTKSLQELSEKYGSSDAEYLEMRVDLRKKVDQLNKNGIEEMLHHAGVLSGHPDYKINSDND